MGKYSTPDTPSAQETSRAQAQANAQTAAVQARLNNVSQFNPYGSWNYTPKAGGATIGYKDPTTKQITQLPLEYELRQNLTPEQQAIFDLMQRGQKNLMQTGVDQLGMIRDTISKPIDFSGLGDVPGMGQYGRTRLEEALFKRLEPEIARDRASLETQLANQGITRGSEAWSNSMGDFGRNVNDARLAVATQAGSEQNRQMAARQQAINEMLSARSVPINEIAALMGGGQVQLPGMSNTPMTPVGQTDAAGNMWNAYSADQAAEQQRQQQISGDAQAGAGAALAIAALAMSDRRLKRDIRAVGRIGPLVVYAFRYAWEQTRRLGFMADEVRAFRPQYVLTAPSGFDMVLYGPLLSEASQWT